MRTQSRFQNEDVQLQVMVKKANWTQHPVPALWGSGDRGWVTCPVASGSLGMVIERAAAVHGGHSQGSRPQPGPPPVGPSRRRAWTLSPQDFPKCTNLSRLLPHLRPPAEAALLDGTTLTPHRPPLPRPRLGHRRHAANAAASPGSPPRQRPGLLSPSVFSSESHPGHSHPGFPCVSHTRATATLDSPA